MFWTILIVVLVCLTGIAAVMVGGRFLTLRSGGIPVVVRSVPNPDARHWRHGILVYGGVYARVYKVRSLRPEPDISLFRQGTSITGRREITAREAQFLEADLHVLALDDGGARWELALDDAGDTALVAWLESAPSTRMVRPQTRIDPRRGLSPR